MLEVRGLIPPEVFFFACWNRDWAVFCAVTCASYSAGVCRRLLRRTGVTGITRFCFLVRSAGRKVSSFEYKLLV